MSDRIASVKRDTLETQIEVSLNLDGTGESGLATGVPFLEHMMDQIARHGMIDLSVKASGDNSIDDHHTVEDIGITIGMALKKALGDKKGIRRYGHAYVPSCRDGFFRAARYGIPCRIYTGAYRGV